MINNNTLKYAYPRLYSISLDQGLKVGELGVWEDLTWHWNFSWIRNKFDWEDALLDEILRTISCIRLDREVNDIKLWEGVEFSLKFAYENISNGVNGNVSHIYKYLRMSKAFPNVLTIA